MVSVSDLYVAVFGFNVQRKLESDIRAEIIDIWHEDEETTFDILVSTNHGAALSITMHQETWYGPWKPKHHEYSRKHKNYTVIAGKRGKEREFLEIPSQKALKEHPNYLALKERQKKFQADRKATIDKGIEDMMHVELMAVMPTYKEVLELTDDTARAYFEKLGWRIGDDIDFKGFRPNGWIMSTRPDGYGHEEGLAAGMDWNNKSITAYGWSSSD